MVRLRLIAGLVLVVLLAGGVSAAPPTPLLTATGVVDKVDRDTLTVKPRGAGGRFEKEMTFKVTGTSKITTLRQQTRAGKPVVVQNDTDLRELQPNQPIAVIYTTGKAGAVLLTAVAVPAAD
jgi:hypothetical protein